MSKQKEDRQLLIEADRRLQEAAQQLLIEKKEKEKLLAEVELKNAELSSAFEKLRKQSSQLIQTAKMASLGVFAGGVAHELNNPLMGILNYIQFCIKHTDKNTQVYKVLQDVEYETKRCAEVIKAVMTFSRLEEEGEEKPIQESIITIFNRVLRLLDYRIRKEGVKVETNFPTENLLITMKPGKMQRVILNILLNSLDALQNSNIKEIIVTVRLENNYLIILIADKGCGIDEKYMGKVFEPFFTTKEADKYIGLGLTIARQIIEEHGGEISCDSILGLGSTFKIRLPKK